MAKEKNTFLTMVHPETRAEYAIQPEGFEEHGFAEKGYRIVQYQDGRKYDGNLPTLTKGQRERLGYREPTPEKDTVEAVQAKQAEKERKQAEKEAAKANKQASKDAPDREQGSLDDTPPAGEAA